MSTFQTHQAVPSEPAGFPFLLRTWRKRRRLSQLDLALVSGVSQRHVSFLESGRSSPSRNMIFQLSETLEVPLRERNDWLVAAGFAPAFRSRPLEDPQMAQVMAAVRRMLANHDPFPAVALDRAWNIVLSNTAFDMLAALLGEDLWSRLGGGPRNIMRLFFHREGMRPFIRNWEAIAPLLWHRAQREAESLDGREMRKVLDDLDADGIAAIPPGPGDAALVPVLPVELEKDGMQLSLFSVIATFGTAQDVTADELRIESMFPADDLTEGFFRSLRGTAEG